MTNEALLVSDVLCFLAGRELDFIHIHGIGIMCRFSGPRGQGMREGSLSGLQLFDSNDVPVKFSSLV